MTTTARAKAVAALAGLIVMLCGALVIADVWFGDTAKQAALLITTRTATYFGGYWSRYRCVYEYAKTGIPYEVVLSASIYTNGSLSELPWNAVTWHLCYTNSNHQPVTSVVNSNPVFLAPDSILYAGWARRCAITAFHANAQAPLCLALIQTNDDRDLDFVSDAWEVNHAMASNNSADARADWNTNGLDNLAEFILCNSDFGTPSALLPLSTNWWGNGDDDGDGMPNWWESNYWGYAASTNQSSAADSDNDGLTDYDEYVAGTNPNVSDSDSDGVPDGWDINPAGANPTPVIVVVSPPPGCEI
jgi:hypothetical protein